LSNMQPNLIKLLELVDKVFQTRNDPTQIGFSEEDMAKMNALHPECLQEAADTNGPYAWVAVIPTSLELMHEFLREAITERQLFERTTTETPMEAIYLCSAIVLPEYRRTRVAYNLSLDAILSMRKQWPVAATFVWPFSEEGEHLARKIARSAELELYVRAHN
jgi:hypothetical protein